MIYYKAGYKYVLHREVQIQTAIRQHQYVYMPHASLRLSGLLFIASGYAWDGPSGPTVDTKTFMRGSLVHDCLYQMIRVGGLSASFREAADNELYRICREDGMSLLRAKYILWSVRMFGRKAAMPSSEPEVLTAP